MIIILWANDGPGWVPGNQANVFVANHDTERVGLYLIGSSDDYSKYFFRAPAR